MFSGILKTIASDFKPVYSIDYPSRECAMRKSPVGPNVTDTAPTDGMLTPYDHERLITYLRLLDADAEGAHWQTIARIVLHIDPIREPVRARRAFDSHLARAKWMVEHGYRHLLRGGPPNVN